jgi:hypothetical protein
MKLALMFLLLACATASANSVKPPAGWAADTKAAISLSQQLGALPHFGGQRSVVTTEAYRAQQGGALFVTRMVANIGTLDEAARNRAASAELGELAATVTRAGATATSDGSTTTAIVDARLLEATQNWHDTATGVVVTSRMVIASDGQQMVAVIGECVLAADAAPDVVTPCTGALASLDPDLDPAKRIALAIVQGAKAPAMKPPSEGSSSPSLMEGVDRPQLPPMSVPQERETDRRPIYVGIGLVILAAIFWWNRKQREKLEKDHEERTGDDKPAPARSDDADDLHAAAEEPEKTEDTSEPAKDDTKETA